MKKKVCLMLIIVMITNFICCNFSYADNVIENDTKITYSKDSYDKLTDQGIVDLDGSETKLSTTESAAGSASGIFASLVPGVFMAGSIIMTHVANDGGFYRTESQYSASDDRWFTISSLVFGEYLLFNPKIYEKTTDLNASITPSGMSKIMNGIKDNAMGWFTILRTVAAAAFLVLLIFSCIRLLLATTDLDRVRYKKVIATWLGGILFVFLAQYIIVILDTIIDTLMNVLWNTRLKLEDGGYSSFEYQLYIDSVANLGNYGGMKALAYGIEAMAFEIVQMMFFGKYIMRTFKLILLVVLSPIIAVLSTLNKIKGSDADVLKDWFKQYVSLLSLQPLHALIYLIFIFTASQIASKAPLLAVVFLWALLRAEKIIKILLNINTGKVTSLFAKK